MGAVSFSEAPCPPDPYRPSYRNALVAAGSMSNNVSFWQ